jgi:phosphoadenosine phosphosulfate reductase
VDKLDTWKPVHVALSGGKDSIVLADLFLRAEIRHQLYTYRTSIDHPQVIQFLNHNYPGAIVLRTKRTFYNLILANGLPSPRRRFCCYYFKERYGSNSIVATGIRRQESQARSTRQMYEQAKNLKSKKIFNPLIHWTDADIWNYIDVLGLPYPDLYDTSQSRIGCLFCPMSSPSQIDLAIREFPGRYKAIISALNTHLGTHPNAYVHIPVERTAESIFDWVYYGRTRQAPRKGA